MPTRVLAMMFSDGTKKKLSILVCGCTHHDAHRENGITRSGVMCGGRRPKSLGLTCCIRGRAPSGQGRRQEGAPQQARSRHEAPKREATHPNLYILTMGEEDDEVGEEESPSVCVIAKPLADSKLTKKILKVVKKGACASALGETRLLSNPGSAQLPAY